MAASRRDPPGDEARMIGWRLRRIRDDRHKSLRVIAELAGMGYSTLHRIERGQRAVTLVEIARLANALQVPASELTILPVPAPANGHTDSTIEAVRVALDAIEAGHPGGVVLPTTVLADQVARIHAQRRVCRFAEVATDLPTLIRNLHTTLATGSEHGELLELAIYLHVHVTLVWLGVAAAPTDLRRRVAFLSRRLAEEHGEVTTLAVAGFAVANRLLAGGAYEVGQAALDSLTMPPTTAANAGLVCALMTTHALAAVLDGRANDATEPLDTAAEVAGRFSATGDTDARGFVRAPADVGVCRMWLAVEADEPDLAISVAQNVQPERHPFPAARAQYWKYYGRALARLRGRHDEAVRALRTAEQIYPTNVRRDPLVREAIAVLLPRTRTDSVAGQELQDMAHRVGLPV
ncbi:MAG: helix-turn-helix domain-containing protein [Pseudonocardiaceae bacterium]